jgi:hypothetical protein
MTTDWVIGHHQAGGKPDKSWNDDRYSMVVGDGAWTINHGPELDRATAGLNGKVFSFCFRGMRHKQWPWSRAWPITDDDLKQLREGMSYARSKGMVTDTPRLNAHCDDVLKPYGNATVCWGNLTERRRAEIYVACQEPGSDWTPVIERLGTLQPGTRGDRVKYLQSLLAVVYPEAGFKMRGFYGPKTVRYVRKFRKFVGLNDKNAGVGPQVWGALLFFAGLKADGK